MTKRIFAFITKIGLFLIFQSLANAQSSPIFGPNKYERTTGAPNTYKNSFQTCNTGATYSIQMENGEGGKDRISSASITLNGIGIVKENEFNQKVDSVEKAVSLQQDNTLDIRLASGPGGFIKVSVYCSANCLDVKMTSPITGSTINKSKIMIQGNLYNTSGEIGVVLQTSGTGGQTSGLAQIQGTKFAGIMPLQTRTNTITAQATDACGYKATDTITINTEAIEEQIRLAPIPSSGIPVLDVTLEAEASLPNPVSNYSWDFNGDGTPDQTGLALSKLTTPYQSPSLFFPKVTITDTQGNTYTETTIVNVLSREEMDAVLKGKWEGMKEALMIRDIEGAVRFFEDKSQETYRQQFNALKPIANLIASEMGQIYFVKMTDNSAEYEIIRTREGVTYSFYLLFVRDKNGLWKIKVF